MSVVKLSVSLADEDVAFIDRYAGEHGVGSRSAVLQRALALLRVNELGAGYAAAWDDWAADDAPDWDVALADGLEAS
jgi:hypothetical protein